MLTRHDNVIFTWERICACLYEKPKPTLEPSLFIYDYCFVSPMLVDSGSPMYLFSNDNCVSKKIHSFFFAKTEDTQY